MKDHMKEPRQLFVQYIYETKLILSYIYRAAKEFNFLIYPACLNWYTTVFLNFLIFKDDPLGLNFESFLGGQHLKY